MLGTSLVDVSGLGGFFLGGCLFWVVKCVNLANIPGDVQDEPSYRGPVEVQIGFLKNTS